MSLRRIPPIVQGIAQVRNWVVEHVPATDSMLGFDLFLKLGNDAVAGQPLQLSAFARGMPYSAEAISGHLQQFEQHGLVSLQQDADLGLVVRPTARFFSLLDNYSLVFESKFIVRDELRGQQLLLQSEHADLANLARILYDRVYDMGWLYLHKHGSQCFMMASLVRRLVELHGHQARVASCYVEIDKRLPDATRRFLLGGKGYAAPGQIEGHAAVVIDEKVLVDFGLGNVRKGLRSDFYWGAVADYRRDGPVLARVELAPDESMTWKDDWQAPEGPAELATCASQVEPVIAQYVERFR